MGSSAEAAHPRVLIVDDEYAIRLLLTSYLRREGGFEVFDAVDGMAAKEMIAEHDFDIIVTDLRMPRMGGLSLIEWAKSADCSAAWIILTGQGTFDDAVRAVHFGAFDFIRKPLENLGALTITINNALRQRQLEADRDRLLKDVQERNARLDRQVDRLREACTLLSEQAQTIDDDFQRAELIQRELLPQNVDGFEGMSVNTMYRPGRNVGGDLYDVKRVNGRYVVAYVADAAGHGVSAAMLAVLFKHRVKMVSDDSDVARQPAEALAEANNMLLNECGMLGLFVTAAYCLLDTETGELTIASAGHPPVLLHRKGGSVEMFNRTGPAMGIRADAHFTQHRTTFGPDDELLLYTDGLFEAAIGEVGLDATETAEIMTQSQQVGEGLLQRLFSEVDGRRKGDQKDDLTLVLLRKTDGDSTLDNAPSVPAQAPAGESGGKGKMLIGVDNETSVISLQHDLDWTLAARFQNACATELNAHRSLTLEMSLCTHLDSTFLGTIHGIVDLAASMGAGIQLQGILETVHDLFDELGMEDVLARTTEDKSPLPTLMTSLTITGEIDSEAMKQVLDAHERLASINDYNRTRFLGFIDKLRDELGEQQSADDAGQQSA